MRSPPPHPHACCCASCTGERTQDQHPPEQACAGGRGWSWCPRRGGCALYRAFRRTPALDGLEMVDPPDDDYATCPYFRPAS